MAITSSSNLLLAALPPEDFLRLGPLLRSTPMATRAIWYKQGDPLETVYFPQGGVCSRVVTMTDGRMAEVGLTGREGAVGFLSAFGQDTAAHEAMVQIPDGGALALSRRDFQSEMARRGALHAGVNEYLLALTAFMSLSVACNALHTAEERAARWLLHAHDRVVSTKFELSHDFLAMMLGVRRPTATLVAGILQRAGLIRYKRGHMEILDRKGLQDASCECYGTIEAHFGTLHPAS